ncbi:hypothetical protein CSHISOI_04420, partial [Colletotrichum shisoi]
MVDATPTSSIDMAALRGALPDSASTSPAAKGPSSVPYEIFLQIIDALAQQVEEKVEPVLFWLTCYPAATNDMLVTDQVDYAGLGNKAPQRQRWRLLRNVTRIDHKTRAKMLETRFRPVGMAFMETGSDFFRTGWICPARDMFLPFVGDRYKVPRLKATLLWPSRSSRAVIQSIQRVRVFKTEFFRYSFGKDVEVLLRLPNVKEISIDMGQIVIVRNTPKAKRHDHAAEMPIDPMLFPELVMWEIQHGKEMKPIWEGAKARGVRILAYSGSGGANLDILELFHTKNGIRMRFLDPSHRHHHTKKTRPTVAMTSAGAIEATKAMQQLHLQPAAKKKRLQLYDVFLNVMDALIDMADDPNDNIRWWVEYSYESATKLSVEMDDEGMKPLKKRFNNIRAISQVDSRIRRLVHRRFPRVPLREGMVQGKPLAPIRAWIRADIDIFIPSFLTDVGQNGIAFHQSLTMPTPAGFDFIQHIEQIFLIGLALISDRTLQSIYRLPNLKLSQLTAWIQCPKASSCIQESLTSTETPFPCLQ